MSRAAKGKSADHVHHAWLIAPAAKGGSAIYQKVPPDSVRHMICQVHWLPWASLSFPHTFANCEPAADLCTRLRLYVSALAERAA